MSNPTSNYSFVMPTSTDLVKDLPADFEVFGQAVDTQMKTNADAAVAKSIVDAKGDLIAATAADTVARVAVGTDGQVLTADAASAAGVKWATAASGGMTLLSTTTLSGASTTISSISGIYKNLFVLIKNVYGNTDATNFNFQFNADSANHYAALIGNIGGSTDNQTRTNLGNIYIGSLGTSSTNAGYKMNMAMNLFNYTDTTGKAFSLTAWAKLNAGNNVFWTAQGSYSGTSAISSITFSPSSGTFSGGSVLIYGVN